MGKFVKMPLELLKPRVEFDPAGKTPKPVPQSVLLTYSWIAKHRDHNTGEAYPSVRLLAELSGLSRRTVQRSIRMLERLGFISVEINNPKGRRQSVNLYRLNGVTPVSRGASPMAQGCDIDDRAGVPHKSPPYNEEDPMKKIHREEPRSQYRFEDCWNFLLGYGYRMPKGSTLDAMDRVWRRAFQNLSTEDVAYLCEEYAAEDKPSKRGYWEWPMPSQLMEAI